MNWMKPVLFCAVVMLTACVTKPLASPVDTEVLDHQLEGVTAVEAKPRIVDSNDRDMAEKIDETFKAGRPVVITINPITEIRALGMKVGKMVRKDGDPIMATISMSERDQTGRADALFQRVIDNLLKEYRWGNLMAPSALPVSCGIEVSGLGGKEMSVVSVEVRCGLKAAVETGNGVFVGRTIHSMLTPSFDTQVNQISAMIDETYREATKLLVSR